MCCVFRPAFGCLQHPKAGRNIFFSRFSTFFVIFGENQTPLMSNGVTTITKVQLNFPFHNFVVVLCFLLA